MGLEAVPTMSHRFLLLLEKGSQRFASSSLSELTFDVPRAVVAVRFRCQGHLPPGPDILTASNYLQWQRSRKTRLVSNMLPHNPDEHNKMKMLRQLN